MPSSTVVALTTAEYLLLLPWVGFSKSGAVLNFNSPEFLSIVKGELPIIDHVEFSTALKVWT